jgi:hypothetical protein
VNAKYNGDVWSYVACVRQLRDASQERSAAYAHLRVTAMVSHTSRSFTSSTTFST